MLATVGPETRVPTCPDWNASDLLWHLAEVQYFWGTIVDQRLLTTDGYVAPARPESTAGLFELFDSASAQLVASLRAAADDVPVWTWAAEHQHVAFVRRRQAHEALIHRVDAELTADTVTDLDPDLATDGIDEALEHMFGGAPEWGDVTDRGLAGRLVATDTETSWLVQMCRWSGTSPVTGTTYENEGMVEVVAADAPDAHETAFEISGTAGDLDAWFWSRPTRSPLQRTGDTSEIDELVAVGIQ